jgi:hypothetical protein
MLKSIPIPSRPFEVVTMDFIPWLPMTEDGHNNLLVIICKLTKFGIFIATDMTITDLGTARLFFEFVLSRFGLPLQIICDRDKRWSQYFWKELCSIMGILRALTTSYHPQADGQTEVLNQTVETALRTYVNRRLNDWDKYLSSFALSYNNTPHSATGYAPAYLLYGYTPTTGSNLWGESNVRSHEAGDAPYPEVKYDEVANQTATELEAYRRHAQDCLVFAQARQERSYNKSHIPTEFEEGEEVLINNHSLELLRSIKGNGQKLLQKFDGPFEILEKLSPVTYRIDLPSTYGIHPILNISHLERYNRSPEELGERPSYPVMRNIDKTPKPDFEIESIVDERFRKPSGKSRRIHEYKVRWKGFDASEDRWKQTKDIFAPQLIKEWEERKAKSAQGSV